MRFLKLALAALLITLAVTVGFVAVAVFAGGLIAYMLGRRIFRRLGGPRPALDQSRASARPRTQLDKGDVIEVTATEVRRDPASP